jgi:uncharacterized protein
MNKLEALKDYIRGLGGLAVAYSSGVDSTFLLKVAHDVLGDRCIAVTAQSASFPKREREESEDFCAKEGIRQIIFETHEMEEEEYASNPSNRCYYCKHTLFSDVIDIAKREGIAYVAEGSNMDDLGDYRPGLQAIKELEVLSPLRQVELTKAEIREYSRALGLPTADKPSFACLASRIPYGERITPEKLAKVEAAEDVLAGYGIPQYRVRVHGNLARIEVPEEYLGFVMEDARRKEITERFRAIGFFYVTVDMKGFRSGSMNEVLS